MQLKFHTYMNGDYAYLYILRLIKYGGTCISPPDPNMQLFTFVSIAFVAFQVGVTANVSCSVPYTVLVLV